MRIFITYHTHRKLPEIGNLRDQFSYSFTVELTVARYDLKTCSETKYCMSEVEIDGLNLK